MQLSKLTTEDLITLNGDFSSKEEVIKYLVSELFEAGKISDK